MESGKRWGCLSGVGLTFYCLQPADPKEEGGYPYVPGFIIPCPRIISPPCPILSPVHSAWGHSSPTSDSHDLETLDRGLGFNTGNTEAGLGMKEEARPRHGLHQEGPRA